MEQTPSDPMGTGCLGKSPWDWPRDLVNIQHSRVPEKGVEKSANGLHRIRWRQVAVVAVHRTDRLFIVYCFACQKLYKSNKI